MCCARVGINNGVWVDGGTVIMGFFATNVSVLIEGVLENWDGHLSGFLPHSLNGNFDLEGLLDSADLGDFLGDLNDNFVDVGGRNLDLVLFFGHLGVLNCARYFLLAALVNDLNSELGLNGASASGGRTSTASLTGTSACTAV